MNGNGKKAARNPCRWCRSGFRCAAPEGQRQSVPSPGSGRRTVNVNLVKMR